MHLSRSALHFNILYWHKALSTVIWTSARFLKTDLCSYFWANWNIEPTWMKVILGVFPWHHRLQPKRWDLASCPHTSWHQIWRLVAHNGTFAGFPIWWTETIFFRSIWIWMKLRWIYDYSYQNVLFVLAPFAIRKIPTKCSNPRKLRYLFRKKIDQSYSCDHKTTAISVPSDTTSLV